MPLVECPVCLGTRVWGDEVCPQCGGHGSVYRVKRRDRKIAERMLEFAEGCVSVHVERTLTLYARAILTGDDSAIIAYDKEQGRGSERAAAGILSEKICLMKSDTMREVFSLLMNVFDGAEGAGRALIDADERMFREEKSAPSLDNPPTES